MVNIGTLAIQVRGVTHGGALPAEYAADHGNRTPEISLDGIPDGTVELVVIVHDPDAPLPNGFTHFVLYGIAPNPGAPSGDRLRVGPNGIGEAAYTGAAPPAGHGLHHYYHWVYALDRELTGTPSREEFLIEYGTHVIEQARVVATYQR